jgi:hypothetical protein
MGSILKPKENPCVASRTRICKRRRIRSQKVYLLLFDLVTISGVSIGIGFIEHSCTQPTTASNYRAIANSHTQQFTIARTKFSVSCVFTSCCLVTASNAVDSSALYVHALTGQRLPHNYLNSRFIPSGGS